MTFQSGRDARPNITYTPINNDFHIQLNNWADCQKEITLCESRKEHEVYRYEWFIGWFKNDKQLLQLPFFNTPAFKEEWRRFCRQVERSRQRFRYAGYYYYRDMERWLLDVSSVREDLTEEDDEDDSEDSEEDPLQQPETVDEALREARRRRVRERRRLKRIYADMMVDDVESEVYKKINRKMQNLLPFGFIEWPRRATDCYGQYYVKRSIIGNRRKLVFKCNDESKRQLYKFAVLDFDAEFIAASDPESPYCGNVAVNNASELLPITPYWDLYLERGRIIEAELAQGDVNSFLAYPEPIPLAKPLPDVQPTALNEHDLYALDSLTEARRQPSEEAQRAAVARANANIADIKKAMGSGNRRAREHLATLVDKRKEFFNRPSILDQIGEALPDNVTVSNLVPPSIILQPQEMLRQYESNICTLMNLPYMFYKPHVDGSAYGNNGRPSGGSRGGGGGGSSFGGGGGSGVNDGTMALYQRLLEDGIQKQQQEFDGFFKEIYYNTFYHLYDRIFVLTGKRVLGTQIEPRVQFERRTIKSDVAVASLLPFYESGIIDASHIRAFLFPSFGIDEPPEIDEELVIKKRSQRGYGEAAKQESAQKKRKT